MSVRDTPNRQVSIVVFRNILSGPVAATEFQQESDIFIRFYSSSDSSAECEFISVLYIHMEIFPLEMLKLFFPCSNVKSVIGMVKEDWCV